MQSGELTEDSQVSHVVNTVSSQTSVFLTSSFVLSSIGPTADALSFASLKNGATLLPLKQLVPWTQAVWYLLGPPNQWGKKRELQDSGTVAVELSGFNGMCILTCVEGKAAGRSDRRHYSLINQQFLLRTATNKATLLQKIYKSFVTLSCLFFET